MKVKKQIKKVVDRIFGTSVAGGDRDVSLAAWNREMKRRDMAVSQAALAAPRRRKYEKRGAPNRSSKGRKPHRVS